MPRSKKRKKRPLTVRKGRYRKDVNNNIEPLVSTGSETTGCPNDHSYVATSRSDIKDDHIYACSDHSPSFMDCDIEHVDHSTSSDNNYIEPLVCTGSETTGCPNDHSYVATSRSDIKADHIYACSDHSPSYMERDIEHVDHSTSSDNSALPPVIMECESDTDTQIVEECISFWEEDVLNPFEVFTNSVKSLCGEKYITKQTPDELQIIELYEGNVPSVKLNITFRSNLTCDVYVHRKQVSKDHAIWSEIPKCLDNPEMAIKLIDRLKTLNVCMGNPDNEYTSLTPVGSGLSDNKSPKIHAYHEGNFCATTKNGQNYDSTIRSVDCALLVKRNRCKECIKYRESLRGRSKRVEEKQKSKRQFTHTTYKHKDMNRTDLIQKLNEQKSEIKSLNEEIGKIRRECDKMIAKKGVQLKPYENPEFSELISSCTSEFQKAFPDPNSRQRLFWDQQTKCISGSAKGMRWHPMIIRWCLQLRQKSAKAYEVLRSTGFVNLPSSRTLFDYSHYLENELGIQPTVLRSLKTEAEKKNMFGEEWKMYSGLLFDEIKIKEDLVYDKHTGELIGFCNLDNIGNEMMDLESMLNENQKTSDRIAKYMLVIMLRSLTCDFTFPVCGYATKSITADYLYPLIWHVVAILESQLSIKVLFFTCDGASANRRFFNLHRVANEEFVYKTINPFDKSRNIYFISDVPHLLKTMRNCFSNSDFHKKSRSLWNNGKDISWLHIVKLFEEHCELKLYTPCPKLTRSHVNLVSFNYMKVNLAAQVLSDTVANALEELYGDHVLETVKFIRHANKFFDCLNVRSLYEGRNKRNPNMMPYKDPTDTRLQYLTDDFLGYIQSWKENVRTRPVNASAAERASMLLSHQTMTGLHISVHSICECIKFMLNKGASFVLTHSFNQDPLEQHFGHYRHRGGANNNPSVYEVRNMMNSIRTVNAQALPSRQGNIRRHGIDNNYFDDSPLPRRQKSS